MRARIGFLYQILSLSLCLIFFQLGLIVFDSPYLSDCVFAAQDTTVIEENAPIRVDPREGAKVLDYLPMGTEIRISSFPMSGEWYKVRAKNGVYGWINKKYLSVHKESSDGVFGKVKKIEEFTPLPERDRKFYLRGFGGFSFFRPDDLNSLFGFSDLNTGYMMGGEIGYFFSEKIVMSFRAEAMVKDIVAKENQSGIQFNLGLRAYPIMLGVDYYFAKLPALRLSLGIYGGMALATSFASEATSLSQPNIVVLQRSPFTSVLRANLTRPLGRIFSVFLEAGYRYLKTDEIETTAATNTQGGPQIYAKDGVFRNRTIDLSGVILSAGLGVHF